MGDHEALAVALIELLDDPGRAEQLGLRGQQLCRETRSPELVDAIYLRPTGRRCSRTGRRPARTPA